MFRASPEPAGAWSTGTIADRQAPQGRVASRPRCRSLDSACDFERQTVRRAGCFSSSQAIGIGRFRRSIGEAGSDADGEMPIGPDQLNPQFVRSDKAGTISGRYPCGAPPPRPCLTVGELLLPWRRDLLEGHREAGIFASLLGHSGPPGRHNSGGSTSVRPGACLRSRLVAFKSQ